MTTTIYGMHLTLRVGNIERPEALTGGDAVSGFLTTLVGRIGMRVLAGPMVAEESGDSHHSGWSGVVILYESHAAVHTYPEIGELFLDVFSCKEFDLETVQETLRSFLGDHVILEQDLHDRGFHWGTDVSQEMDSWRARRPQDTATERPADRQPALAGAR